MWPVCELRCALFPVCTGWSCGESVWQWPETRGGQLTYRLPGMHLPTRSGRLGGLRGDLGGPSARKGDHVRRALGGRLAVARVSNCVCSVPTSPKSQTSQPCNLVQHRGCGACNLLQYKYWFELLDQAACTSERGMQAVDCRLATNFTDVCRDGNSAACRHPPFFLPEAFRIRGTTLGNVAGWPDGAWLEVAHTSGCGAGRCDRGLWLYSARGCSGLLWNVGVSLRALNKLHAHAQLAGVNATCDKVATHLRGTSMSLMRSRSVRAWLRVWHSTVERCSRWVAFFSRQNYATTRTLRVTGGSAFDPLHILGSDLFDGEILKRARQAGYDSVQLLLQPGGGPTGYFEPGGLSLESEFLDCRDARFTCEIEADPSHFLQHARQHSADVPAAASIPCQPTSTFHACMACEQGASASGCAGARPRFGSHLTAHDRVWTWRRWSSQRWRDKRMHVATREWTVSKLVAGLRTLSYEAAGTAFDELALVLSGCPLSRQDVIESVVPVWQKLGNCSAASIKSSATSGAAREGAPCLPVTPCDIVAAIRALPGRLHRRGRAWPLNGTHCWTHR